MTTLGYQTTDLGDANTFGQSSNEILYAPDSYADAQQLQSELVGGAQLVLDSGLTPTPYNLELVTGTNYKGAYGGASPSTGTSGTTGNSGTATATTVPATTTSTLGAAYSGTAQVEADSSSFYHGVYIPPGLQAGQIPQTCGE